MPLNWHFFNFIFIGCFFSRIICVSNEIRNTFQSIQVEKKITQILSKFRFLIKKFFWPEWIFLLVKTMCACIQSEITASGWARLCHIWPNWTLLDHIGPHWTKLGLTRPNWTQLDQIGLIRPNWTKLGQIVQNQIKSSKRFTKLQTIITLQILYKHRQK